MQERVAIAAICIVLLTMSIWGIVLDLRLASKAERQETAGLMDQAACKPSSAMVYSHPDCDTKSHRLNMYYTARMNALAWY